MYKEWTFRIIIGNERDYAIIEEEEMPGITRRIGFTDVIEDAKHICSIHNSFISNETEENK